MLRELEPSLEGLLSNLKPVDDCWQPSDLLPVMGSETWRDEVESLRGEAARLTDEMIVVLAGNIVTEEALPSYLAAINRDHVGGAAGTSGTDSHAWARWSRQWTAEEKRHGDVTRTYLYLTGRANMKAVERTVQHLLRNGFDTNAEGDPYRGMGYAAFQEHATKRAWSQLGQLAGNVGAPLLRRICGVVAADEARHERVYVGLLREALRLDPVGALEALEATLCGGVIMPARSMTDGRDSQLFSRFAGVVHRIGVFTLSDYAESLAQLIETLGLSSLAGLAGEAERAREAICTLPEEHRRRALLGAKQIPRPVPFSWIFDRKV
jgi:acyl-[acyl-carrier-protein] desaturase